MANLFAVGMPFTYDGTTNHFATSSGGSATVAAVTSADDVTIDGSSGSGTLTVGATWSCNTLTLSGSGKALACDGTHGLTVAGAVTLNNGTLNTNSQTCTFGSLLSSNTNARTLTITNSSITVTGTVSVPWDLATTTSLTVNASGSTITMSGGGTNLTWREANTAGSGNTWGTISFTGSGSPVITAPTSTFVNITRNGTAIKTDTFQINSALTITGTLTLKGNTTQGANRLLVQSAVIGTQRTLTMTSAAVVITGDVDFMDINITGSPSWTNTANNWVGDALGNGSLITTNRTVQADQTWNGNTTGSASTAANWTSRTPLPHDNVVINGLTSGTVTMDMPRSGANIALTSSSGGTVNFSVTSTAFGNWTWVAGVTLTFGANFTLGGRGSQTITSAGAAFTRTLTIAAPSGTYTLQDNISVATIANNTLSFREGTFDANGFNVSTMATTAQATSDNKTVKFGSGTWTITGNDTNQNPVFAFNGAGETVTAGTSTIIFTDVTANAKTMGTGSNLTYNNLTVLSSSGGFNFGTSQNATFNTIKFTAPLTVKFPISRTMVCTNLIAWGGSGSLITINSTTGGTTATISSASGNRIACDWLSLKDITATGGATFYAGADSTIGTNVSGWLTQTERGTNLPARTTASSRTAASGRVAAGTRTAVRT